MTNNHLLQKYGYLTVAAVLLCASACFAQDTVQVTLTGVGNGTTLGGVYVDPYTAVVTGLGTTPVICDDWSDET